MARGGAAQSSRGRGKFKVARGGGRQFSRDLDPRLASNQPSSEEEEESSEDDEDEEDVEALNAAQHAAEVAALAPEMKEINLKLGNTELAEPEDSDEELSRAERRARKKAEAQGKTNKKSVKIEEPKDSDEESDSEEEEQPKQQQQQQSKKKQNPPAVVQQSRKEREAAEKKAAQDKYQKLHAQGKTTEAKSDLARLQEVRRRREAAAAQREAEAEEAAKEAAAKKDKLAKKI
ncbi:uncharacterized protein L201_001968 [Kwoniella dendrophila CBS 6074]|uniref:Casein kinase substrate phosphoprotein PP28 domain-containing protein n=1 Tax=Kwoniella dendrophila CBS 6074 TaxID=1295534 RepID=A0AAX4JNU8_9TREE